ncbi:hypothetical protein [Deinococcus misasensis]|uniref:hypothetical protein n=1 Tax=Deinococcus misasensis TaxID=392413 RepID=UPI0005520948|nr:hypothetical protein [Deinococcus misasensis]
MNLVEQMLTFIKTRDLSVLQLPLTEDPRAVCMGCLTLLDHLRLYCRLDRERTLLVTGTGPLAGVQILRSHPEFHRIFWVDELAYGLNIRFHPELPEAERLVLIQTRCKDDVPIRYRIKNMGPK